VVSMQNNSKKYLVVKLVVLIGALAGVVWVMSTLKQNPTGIGEVLQPIPAKVITTQSPKSDSQNNQH
jgi:hypothetical protein